MRVCVLIDAWEPVWGGGQTHVLELSGHLAKGSGVKIDIFTRDLVGSNKPQKYATHEEVFPGVNLYRCGSRTSFSNLIGRLTWLITVINQVRVKHADNPYDLIHAHAYVSGIPAKILGWLLKLPVIYTVHGALNLDQRQFNFTTFLEWLLLTRLRYTAQISVTQNFLKYPNVNRPVYIPNGIQPIAIESKRKINKNDVKQLIWIGRMEKQKGLDVLLNALYFVNQHNKKWKLLLVGGGSQRAYLERLRDKYGLTEQVNFIGILSPASMSNWYEQANIFVLPSRSEGLSLVLLEALIRNLQVIATKVGDNEYLIQDGKNGVLIEPNDPIKLSLAIRKMLIDHNLGKVRSPEYISYLKRTFNWEKISRDTYSIYKKYA